MTEEIRPICLYIETCLDKKEGTRDCAKCEHHLNYWTEVMIRDMEKNINRLEQEVKHWQMECKEAKAKGEWTYDLVRKKVDRLEQENKELKKDVQLFKCLDTFGESECHCACRCLGNEFCEDADKKINSYRSALKEIKSWARQLYYHAIKNPVRREQTIDKIQQKCNEVLNA